MVRRLKRPGGRSPQSFAFQRFNDSPPALLASSNSEPGVTAVAERRRLGVLAAAPGDRFRLREVNLQRREAGALVCAVAEGLALRGTAGTPMVSAGVGWLNERRFLSDFWFGHKVTATIAHRGPLTSLHPGNAAIRAHLSFLPGRFQPSRAIEKSPAFQHWDTGPQRGQVPLRTSERRCDGKGFCRP